MTEGQKDAFREVFHDFQSIFSKDSNDCGVTDLHPVHIPTDPTTPQMFVHQLKIALLAYESIQWILDKFLQK